MWFSGKIWDGTKEFEGALSVDYRGRIDAIRTGFAAEGTVFDSDCLIQAGDFNAHSHPEQSIYTDIVDPSWDLGTWCRHTIYRHSVSLTARSVRLACRRAFGRMVRLGVSSVMVSFYLHGNRDNENARAVIAAARDVGIRLVFGRMNYDIINENAYEGKKASQKSYYEPIEVAARNVRELMSEEDDLVTVCPALHSFHANTPQAIAAGIRLGAELNRPVQLHLSEDQGDVKLSLDAFGVRPLVYLQQLADRGEIPGLDGLIFSDCCWLDDDERSVLAKGRAKVVLNARMNARVKAGFPDLPAILASGVVPWLGTDGEASNDDLSVSGERAFLAKKFSGVVRPQTIERLGQAPFFCGTSTVGDLRVGGWADFRVLRRGKVSELFVGGRQVLRDGRLTQLDEERDIEASLADEVARLTGGK